jgi:hypothetical protein
MSAATAKETTERFIARNECEECGLDGDLIVDRGGGIVSVTCPNCHFSVSAEEGEVDGEWQQFLTTIAALEPHEQRPFAEGAIAGALKSILFFFGALLLNAVDGGGKGLGR